MTAPIFEGGLSKEQFEHACPGFLTNPDEVHILNLAKQNIKHLNLHDMESLFPNLKEVDLSHSHITEINTTQMDLRATFKSLDLSSNKISKIQPGVFDGLFHLETLYLNGTENTAGYESQSWTFCYRHFVTRELNIPGDNAEIYAISLFDTNEKESRKIEKEYCDDLDTSAEKSICMKKTDKNGTFIDCSNHTLRYREEDALYCEAHKFPTYPTIRLKFPQSMNYLIFYAFPL